MEKRLAFAFLVACAGPARLRAGEIPVQPRGEYAHIDVRLANETIRALANGTDAERQRAIDAIELAPEKYAPPVLSQLSNTLFAQGRKDDGAFWFYAGQLRGRYDANRCADVSAREAVAVLTAQFSPPINQYMLKDLPRLEALIQRVVKWDRGTPHEYDHRWINLHGMTAMIESVDSAGGKPQPMSLAREQWDKIAEDTRAQYLDGFRQAMDLLRKQAANAPPPVHAEPGWERRLPGTWKVDELATIRSTPRYQAADAEGKKKAEEFWKGVAAHMPQWTVTGETIAITMPGLEARAAPPLTYRVVKVEGNLATLQLTAADGAAFEWSLEYLEPDGMRVLNGSAEVYRLRRVPAAAPRPGRK